MPLPIPTPSKIVCAGLNYRPHVDEVKLELPERPLLFAKWPSSLIGDREEILLPPQSRQVDYEAELAVVIGRDVRNVSRENALEAVLGYTCLNDVSARDLQFADGQWTRAKSFDTFCPIGPVLVPAAELADPQAVRVRCLVNDEVVQDDTTANMIFPIDELISYASASTTLRRGDVVATGTPAGVALGSANPRWLVDGDVVTVEVEGIGTLTNPVRATG
jgi:2-keto-4-pentenoate hydratase/2-oxohepta-3-ene-1,7-dioic acid hydratase in catechol pathway